MSSVSFLASVVIPNTYIQLPNKLNFREEAYNNIKIVTFKVSTCEITEPQTSMSLKSTLYLQITNESPFNKSSEKLAKI